MFSWYFCGNTVRSCFFEWQEWQEVCKKVVDRHDSFFFDFFKRFFWMSRPILRHTTLKNWRFKLLCGNLISVFPNFQFLLQVFQRVLKVESVHTFGNASSVFSTTCALQLRKITVCGYFITLLLFCTKVTMIRMQVCRWPAMTPPGGRGLQLLFPQQQLLSASSGKTKHKIDAATAEITVILLCNRKKVSSIFTFNDYCEMELWSSVF